MFNYRCVVVPIANTTTQQPQNVSYINRIVWLIKDNAGYIKNYINQREIKMILFKAKENWFEAMLLEGGSKPD